MICSRLLITTCLFLISCSYCDAAVERVEYPDTGGPDGNPAVRQRRMSKKRGWCDGSLFCMVGGIGTKCVRESAAATELCECSPAITKGQEHCVHIPLESPPVCGNGFRETGEMCDDGNRASNDGCSPVCMLEDGFDCVANDNIMDVRHDFRCDRICNDFMNSAYCPLPSFRT
eukprot:NODE_9402_length_644_cov_113.882917_g9136_i0.p1 GENE.NODE_9402_length_644_cov_113.882917_g9136_i0~~NODE_9402_length_644_cov_113.882917_g9136_i0.p1  ORF type:complete len:190 (-),score=20.05 NODE_9402_length_644_cov_113.882917_g9136_i0:73-591(-)